MPGALGEQAKKYAPRRIGDTFYNEPLTGAMDVASVLSGVGGLGRAAAMKAPGLLRAANMATKVGEAIDPTLAAAKGITLLGRQAFRVPGSGADSDRELQTLLDAVQPSSGDFDAANIQKFRQLRRMVGDMEREYAPIAGMPVRAVPPSREFPAPGGAPVPKAAAPKVLRYNPATGELE
jgi:hypothetical protein